MKPIRKTYLDEERKKLQRNTSKLMTSRHICEDLHRIDKAGIKPRT